MCVFLLLSLLVTGIFTEEIGPDNVHFWNKKGEERIRKLLKENKVSARPKNVIFFLGDGMGISIVTASRSYNSRKKGILDPTPNHFFEEFPTSGLVKTASFNNHVTDSAAGAVALFAGQKEFLLTVPNSSNNCSEGKQSHINFGIAELALNAGMNAGFVTTTRITHATPAALYAKGVNRSLEYDEQTEGTSCTDIAAQLLDYPANSFKVLLGGGSAFLKPTSDGGSRLDGRNIQKEWEKLGGRRAAIEDLEDLEKINLNEVDHLMGAFSPSEFPYHLDELLNDTKTVPRLVEMTKTAIKMMEKDEKGYFLMIEGGLIDYGEHLNQLHIAFEELDEFEEAVRAARELTDPRETLIIVTADHSHALSIPGYMHKDKDMLGTDEHYFKRELLPETERVMPGLLFASGPGYFTDRDFKNELKDDPHFATPAVVAMRQGVHGGDDVGIWTDGPGHWLFSGSIENTQVAYTIKYLLCISDEISVCQDGGEYVPLSDHTVLVLSIFLIFCLIVSAVFIGLYYLEMRKKRNLNKISPAKLEMNGRL